MAPRVEYYNTYIIQANKAEVTDLNKTEDGKRPLSLRMKRASYVGKFIKTISPQRIIWRMNLFKPLKNNSKFKAATFLIPSNKPKRFSIANVAIILYIISELPNSMISCSYRFDTSSAATLAVTANLV